MSVRQWAWMMFIILKAMWKIACSSPVVQTVSCWANATMTVVAQICLRPFALGGTTSCPAPLLHSLGEDDSPKPS